ncbi:MAG TPA: TaqI-like C-terminal specificity domain-containing protein [Verrucomicrobiae bacterium]|jgi:type I restriction-modification system DNA methylase subunit|nr:TaqI-like C-terminal specificity domain-containing protein [Verrucomicrobiae bacterium]
MPANFEDAFARVNQLAAEFKANEKFYLSPQYQEAEARRDFIDKFLIALGWDVNHDAQKNPYEQEVKVERKEQGVSQRRADYAFYLAPNFRDVKFYIEAKKPHGDIATQDNYFQVIRYGWNSQTPIAALFDFEQFEIVDCRFKPDLETALQRNLKKFHYSQYSNEETFAEIYWLFSHEAIAGDSLEKYAKTLPKKRGTVQRGLFKGGYQSIDEAFLEELDAHRDDLAHIFKNQNSQLDGGTLTEITQRTLDRLVFIRFLEDKLIEPQYLIDGFGERGSAWGDFIATSRRLDGFYNGIVFKENAVLDKTVKVDDGQFSRICEAFSRLNSPYDFNAIPIHILGSIYERFLGKVIVATDKRARVEEKPEVRKAGGVYYTPEYIVRYIVENTVGKLIDGKTPSQIAEMRFADIACGSGSFLLGVYDLLIRHHTKFFNDNPGKAKKGDVLQREDGLHLSLQKKRQILLNNVYGVDIDAQAVEVAQLSLYLKLLQDETPASARGYQMEFRETLLPSLSKNIVCGNSLIGTDIESLQLFLGDEERKLNPMDYQQRFPEIMKRGGFDAVLGDPPYILLQILEQPHVFDYISGKFRAARYKIDTYHVFIEQALHLTKDGGMIGYITPNSFLRNKHAQELRSLILSSSEIQTLRLFYYGVFKGASVDTSVLILKRANKPNPRCKVSIVTSASPNEIKECGKQPQSVWLEHTEHHFSLPGQKGFTELAAKIKSKSILLGDFATAYFGIQTFDRTKYVSTTRAPDFRPVIDGEHILRFALQKGAEYVDFRPEAIKSGGKKFVYEQDRIGVRQIGMTPIATFLPAGLYTLNTIYNIFFTKPTKYSLQFILGIISSKCLCWFWRQTFFDQKETFPKIKKDALLSIPVPRLDFSKAYDESSHDKVGSLVEQMLATQKQLAGAHTDKDKDFYFNKCESLDQQIDTLVYELYGLTADEIRTVVGAGA